MSTVSLFLQYFSEDPDYIPESRSTGKYFVYSTIFEILLHVSRGVELQIKTDTWILS